MITLELGDQNIWKVTNDRSMNASKASILNVGGNAVTNFLFMWLINTSFKYYKTFDNYLNENDRGNERKTERENNFELWKIKSTLY